MKRLLTYTTFFVTRNPYERLVSAYTSKFTNNSLSIDYKQKIGRTIAFKQAKFYISGIHYKQIR